MTGSRCACKCGCVFTCLCPHGHATDRWLLQYRSCDLRQMIRSGNVEALKLRQLHMAFSLDHQSKRRGRSAAAAAAAASYGAQRHRITEASNKHGEPDRKKHTFVYKTI